MNNYSGTTELYVWKKGDSLDMIDAIYPIDANFEWIDYLDTWCVLYKKLRDGSYHIYAECSGSYVDGKYVIGDIVANRHNPELFKRVKKIFKSK